MDTQYVLHERIAELREFESEDEPFVDDILRSTLRTAKDTIAYLKSDFPQGESNRVRSKAHTALGSCLDAGYCHLARLFEQIESLADDPQYIVDAHMMDRLTDSYIKTEQEVYQLLAPG